MRGNRQDHAGRRYTLRSHFVIPPSPAEVARILEEAIPQDADRERGRWFTWSEVRTHIPGVSHQTFETHTRVVRPGSGLNGIATCYIWIDPRVEARVRKPPLEEVVSALGLPGEAVANFHLRADVFRLLRDRFGMPSEDRWRAAANRGHILEVKAAGGAGSRSRRVYALVPREVLVATEWAVVEDFLKGRRPEWRSPVEVGAHRRPRKGRSPL